ncbi:pectin lyase-like protein [Colletotrichum eremochloae]|nr:pectin lyase-like protein [Colletotrichum eremochloae]
MPIRGFYKFLLAISPAVLAVDLYIAPTGFGSAAGTLVTPLKSIQVAVDKAVAGDTLYLRAGTYSPTTNIRITKCRAASVVIDGEASPRTLAALDALLHSTYRGVVHIEKAHYWKFYQLTIINDPYGVFLRDSYNNYFESIVTHDNYETGFQMQGALSNNQIVYLDSFRNRSHLWENVDDSLNLWEFKPPVTIMDTISWGNGVNRWGFSDFREDGNGLNLGGGDAADIGAADHLPFTRNTAWNNGASGFQTIKSKSTLKDNVAASNSRMTAKSSQTSLVSDVASSGNSWDGSATWSNTSCAALLVPYGCGDWFTLMGGRLVLNWQAGLTDAAYRYRYVLLVLLTFWRYISRVF